MVWPDAVPAAIDAIRSAPFLTAAQKRDILHDNAAASESSGRRLTGTRHPMQQGTGHRSILGMRTAAAALSRDDMAVPPLHTIRFGRAAPTIRVRDIAIARRFYEDILGFRTVFANGDPVGFLVLAKDSAEIHLSRAPDHRASTTNVFHLMVDDAAALHAALASAGVRIVKRLADKDYGQRAFVFTDPDGNRIDVGERLTRRESASPAPSHSPA